MPKDDPKDELTERLNELHNHASTAETRYEFLDELVESLDDYGRELDETDPGPFASGFAYARYQVRHFQLSYCGGECSCDPPTPFPEKHTGGVWKCGFCGDELLAGDEVTYGEWD